MKLSYIQKFKKINTWCLTNLYAVTISHQVSPVIAIPLSLWPLGFTAVSTVVSNTVSACILLVFVSSLCLRAALFFVIREFNELSQNKRQNLNNLSMAVYITKNAEWIYSLNIPHKNNEIRSTENYSFIYHGHYHHLT